MCKSLCCDWPMFISQIPLRVNHSADWSGVWVPGPYRRGHRVSNTHCFIRREWTFWERLYRGMRLLHYLSTSNQPISLNTYSCMFKQYRKGVKARCWIIILTNPFREVNLFLFCARYFKVDIYESECIVWRMSVN